MGVFTISSFFFLKVLGPNIFAVAITQFITFLFSYLSFMVCFHRTPNLTNFLKFSAVNLAFLIVNKLLLITSMQLVGKNDEFYITLYILLSIVILAPLSFILNKYFTFKRNK